MPTYALGNVAGVLASPFRLWILFGVAFFGQGDADHPIAFIEIFRGFAAGQSDKRMAASLGVVMHINSLGGRGIESRTHDEFVGDASRLDF